MARMPRVYYGLLAHDSTTSRRNPVFSPLPAGMTCYVRGLTMDSKEVNEVLLVNREGERAACPFTFSIPWVECHLAIRVDCGVPRLLVFCVNLCRFGPFFAV